ncbi:MAG: fluoride efflux transporter CrcB [Planctomycetota bacterium]
MIPILLVGLGGFLGAILRYLISTGLQKWTSSTFPYGTLTVNLLGCFLIGILMFLAQEKQTLSPSYRLLLVTGFLGGFTTFSAFGYESMRLFWEGQVGLAWLNISLQVFGGLVAVEAGRQTVRLFS